MERILKKRRDLSRRHRRLRRKLSGSSERPRLAVFRSLRHIYAQLVDDSSGRTLLAVSTGSPEFPEGTYGGNVKAAEILGGLVADKAKAAGFRLVVFDSGGRKYHGRVKALADAARKGGLEF
ncbi:MAG: 50S ribosomal protein L18 [Planctomycetota bacterium]|jgi:large subunit ribosomal protein L18|nr:50S ribosomal protein L18 [Planctomycetota bacterium]